MTSKIEEHEYYDQLLIGLKQGKKQAMIKLIDESGLPEYYRILFKQKLGELK